LTSLKGYSNAEAKRRREEALAQGVDLIFLATGDPDLPTPAPIIEALTRAAADPATHRYGPFDGIPEFRMGLVEWYKRMFGVELEMNEICILAGSKEGLGRLPLALLDPGDIALVPDPGFPPYARAIRLANGVPHPMPLLRENDFLPDLSRIESDIAKKAKLMILNYPHNPTGGVATVDFFQEVIGFAKFYGIVVCHDFAYCTVVFHGYKAPSFLSIKGAKEVGVEINSLSKPYNMAGWRCGFLAGNREVVKAFGSVRTNLDSGIFQAVQRAGLTALSTSPVWLEDMRKVYERRRDIVVNGLRRLGWDVYAPRGTFYVWIPVPKPYNSVQFTDLLFKEAGVVVSPGNSFGRYGEGYIRISTTVADERLREFIRRLEKLKL
jgi:LL-diaminopimelate aminotransferase